MNVKVHSYTLKVRNFSCIFTVPVKFDIPFLCNPLEMFLGVIIENQKSM